MLSRDSRSPEYTKQEKEVLSWLKGNAIDLRQVKDNPGFGVKRFLSNDNEVAHRPLTTNNTSPSVLGSTAQTQGQAALEGAQPKKEDAIEFVPAAVFTRLKNNRIMPLSQLKKREVQKQYERLGDTLGSYHCQEVISNLYLNEIAYQMQQSLHGGPFWNRLCHASASFFSFMEGSQKDLPFCPIGITATRYVQPVSFPAFLKAKSNYRQKKKQIQNQLEKGQHPQNNQNNQNNENNQNDQNPQNSENNEKNQNNQSTDQNQDEEKHITVETKQITVLETKKQDKESEFQGQAASDFRVVTLEMPFDEPRDLFPFVHLTKTRIFLASLVALCFSTAIYYVRK